MGVVGVVVCSGLFEFLGALSIRYCETRWACRNLIMDIGLSRKERERVRDVQKKWVFDY